MLHIVHIASEKPKPDREPAVVFNHNDNAGDLPPRDMTNLVQLLASVCLPYPFALWKETAEARL